MTKNTGFLSNFKNALESHRVGDLLLRKGLITTQELQNALTYQAQTRKPLGQVLIEQALITRKDLVFLLWKQRALRTCTALILFGVTLAGTFDKKAKADPLNNGPQIILASTALNPISHYPALYGMSEKRSSNLQPFKKWTSLFERFENQLHSEGKKAQLEAWEHVLNDVSRGSIKDMARQVNDNVNAIRYISDKNNWGKSDYWATPIEFLQRGGDCEDYAITKYVALRALGVSEDRLRMAIVQDTEKNIPHAVLVVYTESGAYILDNQSEDLLTAEYGSRYRPIYSINRQGWWLHSAPDSTQMASAQ